MNNVHPTLRPFLWFAPPAIATGNHLAAANDEPEPVKPEPDRDDLSRACDQRVMAREVGR